VILNLNLSWDQFCTLINILEQSPYTKTIQLSYFFENNAEALLEPAVKIRLYFDVCTAEVLRDYKRVEVSKAVEDISLSKGYRSHC
jgi:uncharacterized protein YqiB (DUF1249 family)